MVLLDSPLPVSSRYSLPPSFITTIILPSVTCHPGFEGQCWISCQKTATSPHFINISITGSDKQAFTPTLRQDQPIKAATLVFESGRMVGNLQRIHTCRQAGRQAGRQAENRYRSAWKQPKLVRWFYGGSIQSSTSCFAVFSFLPVIITVSHWVSPPCCSLFSSR